MNLKYRPMSILIKVHKILQTDCVIIVLNIRDIKNRPKISRIDLAKHV